MVEFGPIQLIAVGFPDSSKLKGEVLKEIISLSEAGILRLIGLLAIVKDEKGNVETVQLSELSDEDRMKLGAGIGALIGLGVAGSKGAVAGAEAGIEATAQREFGLDSEDIKELAEEIPNGTAASLLLV